MKVIDLLVKIANGEEVPERIIFYYNEFYYDKDNLKYRNVEEGKDNLFEHIDFYKGLVLNDEVEIIEDTPKEDKKIEKISLDDYVEFTTHGDIQRIDYMFNKNTNTFVDKINEIIDKINGEIK